MLVRYAASMLLLLCLHAAARAEAPAEARGSAGEPRADALRQRLDSLDEGERKLLAPFMERGPIGLVEFSLRDELPAVLVASYIEAPAAAVAQIIRTPAEYPRFMHTLDSVDVLSNVGAQTAYKWTFRTGVLFLSGENRMMAYDPPPGHPEQGYRIAVSSERGHLGEGRLMWRVFSAGPARSLVVLSMRVDMRDANFVMRQLDAAARSLNRSINLSLCYVMLLSTKQEAERRAHATPALPEAVPLEQPKVDLEALKSLLGRADLVLMELTSRGVGKLGIVGRTGMKRSDLWPVMTEPETFGKSLVPGSYTTVTHREGMLREFAWGIKLPLIGSEGTMRLEAKDDQTVFIDAISGAMKGGKWRFTMPTLSTGEAVVVGWSLFDISRASWLIEKVSEVDPLMGHGLAASTQVMMLRALRNRAKLEKTRSETPQPNKDLPPANP